MQMIHFITMALGGEGYLNFMGNEVNILIRISVRGTLVVLFPGSRMSHLIYLLSFYRNAIAADDTMQFITFCSPQSQSETHFMI